jgi:hypothetical protein
MQLIAALAKAYLAGFPPVFGRSQSAFTAPALWQHGFELPTHPIKVTTQLGDNGTVREVRTVHVVG